KFTVTNNGAIRLYGGSSGFTALQAPSVAGNNTLVLPTGNGNSGQALTTDGTGILSWSNVALGTSSPFRSASELIVQNNTTQDFLLGGVATTSAKFAFINVAGGTPTASISAVSTNNALSLDASG